MTATERSNRSKDWISQVQQYVHGHRATVHPFSMEGTALLVIDMQRFFTNPSSHASFPDADAIIGNVQHILASFRACGLPVFFTRHALAKGENAGIMGTWWGEALTVDDPLSAIDQRVGPLTTERVIRKSRYSTFVGTDLETILVASKITRLVIVGVMTHPCCESTARDAFMHDHEVFFIVDATASKDEDLHLGSLKALADGFAILATTEEVLNWMR